MPTKDEVAKKLIRWHFQLAPDMRDIYRFITPDEDRPGEPIKLLEVTNSTPASGSVMTFTFGPADDIIYPSTVAQVTPEEMVKIRNGEISLPQGWSLQHTQHFIGPKQRRLKIQRSQSARRNAVR